MIPQLSIPNGSKFDLERAVELLTLTENAQNTHARFKEGLENDWETWHNRDDQASPMQLPIEGHGTYQIYGMLERAEFMWGRRTVVPFGFIAKKENTLYVVFRGTATRAEWVSNVRGFHRKYSPVADSGDAHRGFHAIYTRPDRGRWWSNLLDGRLNFRRGNDKPSMAQMVEALLTNKDSLRKMGVDADTRLFVTGHSLGGALATLAALHISKTTDFTNPVLYAFANPRAGDGNFAKACAHLEAYRIFNSEDLVPTLPFPTIKLRGEKVDRADVEKQYQVLKLLPPQSYAHVGESIAFTDHRGTIPANHVIGSYLDFLTGRNAQASNANAQGVNSGSGAGQPQPNPA